MGNRHLGFQGGDILISMCCVHKDSCFNDKFQGSRYLLSRYRKSDKKMESFSNSIKDTWAGLDIESPCSSVCHKSCNVNNSQSIRLIIFLHKIEWHPVYFTKTSAAPFGNRSL